MARQNKRNRDERRFGKARLIDRLLGEQWQYPAWWDRSSELSETTNRATCDYYRRSLAASTAVEASNVCAYWQEEEKRRAGRHWSVTEDFPTPRPAFDNLFIECVGSVPDHPSCGRRWGAHIGTNEIDSLGYSDIKLPAGSKTASLFSLFIETTEGKLIAPGALVILILDAAGNPLDSRGGLFIAGKPCGGCPEHLLAVETFMVSHLTPIYLAVSFMHCKNVVVEPVEPPSEINRERKKAGLKPFVRYHTINIEPMKKVLRTEGNIETEGLKRALHICRGHFSHYSEEKPLFGKHAGTFWIPSHVRGEIKQGIVISDYNVKPPANP